MDSCGPRSRVWPYSRADHAPVIWHMASMMGQWTNYNLRQYNSGLAHPHLRSDSSSTPGWFSNRKESALPLAAGEQSPLQVAHQAMANLALTSARASLAAGFPATTTESLKLVSALRRCRRQKHPPIYLMGKKEETPRLAPASIDNPRLFRNYTPIN